MSIVLLPVGAIDAGILPPLRERLHRIFGEEVRVGEGVPLPRRTWNEQRGQYEAETLLDAVARSSPPTGTDRVLGITGADLYVPGLNFIFGLAKQQTAIISTHRLHQSFYGLPKDRRVFCRRVLVEAVHELGHTYGLSHCLDPACVMYFSNTIEQTDRKGPGFCPACHSRISAGVIQQ